MSQQITLSDDDYALLKAAAEHSGQPIETLLHALVSERLRRANGQPPGKRTGEQILAGLPGHQLFQSANEIDDYLREERDAWER